MSPDAEESRPLEEVQRDLCRLREVQDAFRDLPSPDFAAQVQILSLEARESELLAEESAAILAASESDVTLVLEGEAVSNHAIEAAFLADVLGKLQGLTNAVAEARAGEARSRGVVRGDVRESVRLMVDSAFLAASFAIRLTVPPQPDQLFGHGVLGTTISLFDPDPEHGQFLNMLRLDRVRANFTDLMKSMVRHRSSMAVASAELTHHVAFTPRMAKERLDWMELMEVSKEPLKVVGVLQGGDLDKRTYNLVAEEEHYSGRVLETALADLRAVSLGSEVEAQLLVVTKSQADDIIPSRTSYYLESVAVSATNNGLDLDV